MKNYFSFISVLIVLIIWGLASLVSSPFLLPSPLAVGKAFFFMFGQGVGLDLLFTLGRILTCLFLIILYGVPLGLILGYYPKIYRSLEFLIDFGRSVPPPMLFPLFILAFGIGEPSKIFPVVIAGSFYVIINTMYGVRNVKKLRLEWAKTIDLSKFNLFRKIILPEASPHIFTGIRIALSVTLILVLLFEMFVGTRFGIGQRVIEAQMMYRVPLMYALIILTGIVGYLMNKSFLLYEQRKTHWWGK